MSTVWEQSTAWTEWMAAIGCAEALVLWDVEASPGRWAGPVDDRPPVMALLAAAIQATARERGLLLNQSLLLGPEQLDQMWQLPLRAIATHLDVGQARALIAQHNGLGPATGQAGADERIAWATAYGPAAVQAGTDAWAQVLAAGTNPDQWRVLVTRAAAVMTSHRAAARRAAPTLEDRAQALAQRERAEILRAVAQVFPDEDEY